MILYLIILIGAFLAIYQFMFNRSLWIDEASLALNIINKDFLELTKPLDYNQVAPVGFLFIERVSILIFGKNELALRIFPLISFLTSIYLFYLLSNDLVKNKIITLLATSIFSITLLLLRYSSEVKQYSIDVLIAIVILYFCFRLQFNRNKSIFLYGIIGGITIWFSNISIIILFTTGVYLLYFEAYKHKHYKILFPVLFWVVSFIVYYYLFINNHPHTEFQVNWWNRQHAFLPLNPFSKYFYLFLLRANKTIYNLLFDFGHFWFIPLIISLSSIVFLLKQKKYIILYFCLTPIIVHLLLSSLKLYPFYTRVLLYITPLVILILSIGLYYIVEFINAKIIRLPYFLLIVPVIIMFYPIYQSFPIKKEEIKDSLSYIDQNIKNDEEIYIYYGARRAFTFYNEIKFINLNNVIIYGTKHRKQIGKYDHELLNLKGKVWLLFSHVVDGREEKYMIKLLLNNGSELLDKKKYRRSSVYYFDTKKTTAHYGDLLVYNYIGQIRIRNVIERHGNKTPAQLHEEQAALMRRAA